MELTNEQVMIIAKEMSKSVKEAILEIYEKDVDYYTDRPIFAAIESAVKEVFKIDFEDARRCRSNLTFDAISNGVEEILGGNLVDNRDTVARAIKDGTYKAISEKED